MLAFISFFSHNTLYEGGDLDRLLADKSKEFPLSQKIRILLDVAAGMNWLHCSSPPIIHRDLKPGNILVRPQSFSQFPHTSLLPTCPVPKSGTWD